MTRMSLGLGTGHYIYINYGVGGGGGVIAGTQLFAPPPPQRR